MSNAGWTGPLRPVAAMPVLALLAAVTTTSAVTVRLASQPGHRSVEVPVVDAP